MGFALDVEAVLIGTSSGKRIIFNGEVSATRTVTKTVVRRHWSTRMVQDPGGGWHLERFGASEQGAYSDETVSTENSTETITRWYKVVASVSTKVTEYRGWGEGKEGSLGIQPSQLWDDSYAVISESAPANVVTTQYLNLYYDLITTISRGAASKSVTLTECVGTAHELSGKRVDDAGFWVYTDTETTSAIISRTVT